MSLVVIGGSSGIGLATAEQLLGGIDVLISATAATFVPELLKDIALHALGLEVNELYGMSETIIVSTSPPDDIRIGTCGVPLPGVEVLRDGWMHSGDIGVIDADGFVTITDRKKALIISSAGKNMSPSAIEQAIKGGVPLIATALAAGNAKLARVEQIKRHAVLDHDRAPASDELTPTAKLKRGPIAERYPAVIEALYA